MKLQYCTQSGRSRPKRSRMASMSAWLAPGSTSSIAGSPVTRTKKKMVSDRRNSDSRE